MPDHDETRSPEDALGLDAPALRHYATIVAALPGRIALVDRGCRLLTANAAFLHSIGRRPDEAIGQSFMSLCGDSALTTLLYRHLSACLDQAQTLVDDWIESPEHGEPRQHEVRLLPCRDAAGQVSGIVIEVRDVSAVRDAERRLLQSATVYAATSEGVLITDPEGTVVAVNAAFTQITGYG